MKKAIIVYPSFMQLDRIEDNNRIMREVMAKECDFDMLIIDRIDLEVVKNYDVVFIEPHKYLQRSNYKNTLKMMSLPIKIIAYAGDMDVPFDNKVYDIEAYKEHQKAFFLRSDKILCDMYWYLSVLFESVYDKIHPKMVWWPKAVVAYNRYFDLPFNENPTLKCSIAGKIDDRFALRKYIYKHCKEHVAYYSHPGYNHIDIQKYPTGDRFAVELNKYICGACGSKTETRHVVEKYVIIPASGSLLLAERNQDFDMLGMEDGKHYVSINIKNAKAVIRDVIDNPENYRQIRLVGREFIRQNHTMKNRLEILNRVLAEMANA